MTAMALGTGVDFAFRRRRLAPVPSEGAPPVLLLPPRLRGSGRIGSALSLEPGAWSGNPQPRIAVQWQREGRNIPGATGMGFVPGPEDDGAPLLCVVTAQNAFGVAQARSDAITATHPGPTALGRLRDLTYGFNSGVQVLNAFPEFNGDALTFSVTGEGVSVDPETGLVRILTDALRDGVVVTVTASNSGGTASSSFQVTVTAAAEPEPRPEPQPQPEPEPQPEFPVGMPPAAVGAIADVIFAPNSGLQSVSSQAHFAGEGLVYSLDAAPEGVTIHAGSGLVVIATEEPLSEATVTVRASNAAGFALQSFSVTVNGASISRFDTAEALADLGFVTSGETPSWTAEAAGFGRLIPGGTGRSHGVWGKAGGDGLYRCLARWDFAEPNVNHTPFYFGARIAYEGETFTGFFISAVRLPSGMNSLELRQYTGTTVKTTLLASVASDWIAKTWYWFEIEIAGASVKARLYPELETAPAWQLESTVDATMLSAAGAFGPGGFRKGEVRPVIDVRQLEFRPSGTEEQAPPPAAGDGDWTLAQVTE